MDKHIIFAKNEKELRKIQLNNWLAIICIDALMISLILIVISGFISLSK